MPLCLILGIFCDKLKYERRTKSALFRAIEHKGCPILCGFFSLFCQKSECVPVQTGTEFALHHDIDSFLKKELNFMKKTHLLYIVLPFTFQFPAIKRSCAGLCGTVASA